MVGLVIGRVLRSWYLTLERNVPGAVKTAGFKKMLLDQSLFAPLMICFFFIGSETLAGKRPHEINEMLKECYVQTLMITNLIQDLVPCRDSEFYVCSHSAPCLSKLQQYFGTHIPSCHGWLTSHNLMLQPFWCSDVTHSTCCMDSWFSRAGQPEVYLLTIMSIFPMQLHCKY